MKSPENIQKLIALLSQSSIEDYNRVLNNFNFESIDFKPFESWSEEKYTRNCLYRDDKFELILLCWRKGQGTSIHGHDGEDCWVYLLEGEMEEVLFSLDDNNHLSQVDTQKVLPCQLTFMNDKIGFHTLKNSFDGLSISLHLYAKPIEHCVSYDETSERFIERQLRYDTFKQLELKD